MGKPRKTDLPDLSHLAIAGAVIRVRATPKARRNKVTAAEDGTLKIHVTAVPENGKANAAVLELLARAMGVAPSRLLLTQGATARDKCFVYSGASRS